ncbi:hypothetical protein BGW41_005199 [Actinomortierella wolfii]|nr:hypothetical protein BGW41_005199 [Actinomortierella wolfii]
MKVTANPAAAAYAEQYQQYIKDYEKWAAANPEYQHQPPAPPFDYSAYQQQQQQQQQQQLTPEQQQQYAQQWAAYYAQYGYTAPPAPASTATTPVSAAAQSQAAAYSAYYAQYPPAAGAPSSAAPSAQAYTYPTAAAAYPPYPSVSQPAPAQSAYPYPYQYPAQHPPPPHQHQSQYRAPHSSNSYPSSYSQRPPASSPAQAQQPAPTPAASQTSANAQAQGLKRKTEDVRQQLQTTSLEDQSNMTKTTYEKPAYLAVKAKKVKPHANNVLNANGNTSSTTASTPASTATNASSQPTDNANRADSWPPSLKNYVKRVFESVDDKYRDEAHKKLKALVSKCHLENTLWTTDWDSMEVPEEFTRGKRRSSPSPERGNRLSVEEENRREKRRRRFEEQLKAKPLVRSPSTDYPTPPSNGDVDWDRFTIVGTCQELEKPYLRLTSAPDPSTVRPLEVLKKTMELLKQKWREDCPYTYICDQFRSLRQDLVVQRIKNEFTVSVYEAHARIALEKGDLGEYHQCQTQLKHLYAENIPGCVMEFTAYRILYLIHTRNPSDITSMLASLTKEQKENEFVQHALAVRRALSTSNYYQLFKLYLTVPNMGAFLMDQFVERERVEAMKSMARSIRVVLHIRHLTSVLAFKNEDECQKFLVDHGLGKLIKPKSETDPSLVIDSKAAIPILDAAASKYHVTDLKGQL